MKPITITVRVTPEMKQQLERKATELSRKAGFPITVSTWVRKTLQEAIK